MVRPGSLMTDLRKPICGDLVTTFTSSELLVRQATQPWLVPADFPGPVRRPYRAIQSVVAGLSLVPTSDQRQHHHCHPHHCACCFTSNNFPLTINVVLAAIQTLIRSADGTNISLYKSKPLDDATKVDFTNLNINIVMIHVIAILIFRLVQSTFVDSSRGLLLCKDLFAAFTYSYDADVGCALIGGVPLQRVVSGWVVMLSVGDALLAAAAKS